MKTLTTTEQLDKLDVVERRLWEAYELMERAMADVYQMLTMVGGDEYRLLRDLHEHVYTARCGVIGVAKETIGVKANLKPDAE